MKPLIILIAGLILMGGMTLGIANLMDRQIISIENCYKLDLKLELEEENETYVEFVGCNNLGNNTWNCSCREDDNRYQLVMRTDKTMLRNAREYELKIEAVLYNFKEDSTKVTIKDWGDYTEVKGRDLEDFGTDEEKVTEIIVPEYIYINKTIEILVDKIMEKPVYIEVKVDNETKLQELNNQIIERDNRINELNEIVTTQANNLIKKDRGARNTFIILMSLLAICLIIIFVLYVLYTKKKGDKLGLEWE